MSVQFTLRAPLQENIMSIIREMWEERVATFFVELEDLATKFEKFAKQPGNGDFYIGIEQSYIAAAEDLRDLIAKGRKDL